MFNDEDTDTTLEEYLSTVDEVGETACDTLEVEPEEVVCSSTRLRWDFMGG